MIDVVGILGFQGCIEPHQELLWELGVTAKIVKSAADLETVERLILPGGESTTMLRFLDRHSIGAALAEFARTKPVWGICAGAILLAREVVNPDQRSLNAIDIRATRNFYGSQLDSFSADITVEYLGGRVMRSHFIRAPLLTPMQPSAPRQPGCIQATHEGHPVFITQGKNWACSFHVELGNDCSLHKAFLEL